jgi:hypothetical protein
MKREVCIKAAPKRRTPNERKISMFNSIIETESVEHVPQSSPPWVWVGFVFAGAFFVIEITLAVLQVDAALLQAVLLPIAVGGWIYWLVCVHRIHKILNELTRNRYPYTPGEAAAKHIIPFYNIVWLFRWPIELSNYLNRKGRVQIISGGAIGTMLLLSHFLRWVDGAVGMAALFGVTMYISAKVKKHAKVLEGVTPDQLPPLPDPRIFGRPVENPITPAAEVVEGQ